MYPGTLLVVKSGCGIEFLSDTCEILPQSHIRESHFPRIFQEECHDRHEPYNCGRQQAHG